MKNSALLMTIAAFGFHLIGCAAVEAQAINGPAIRPHAPPYPQRAPYRGRIAKSDASFHSVFAFDYTNGGFPTQGLFSQGRALFGSAVAGPANEEGALFKLGVTGSSPRPNTWALTWNNNTPINPTIGLLAQDGTLYGTAAGGTYQQGTIFAVSPSGAVDVLHNFNATVDGQFPAAPLVALDGSLYGATGFGINNGCGTIFKFARAGRAETWELTTIHNFTCVDGMDPNGVMTFGGMLIGTTGYGGSENFGTAFIMEPDGSNFQTIANFPGRSIPGPLIQAGNMVVGTSYWGGANYYGYVFSLTPSTATSWNFNILYSFGGGTDGAYPSGLTFYKGRLFGATSVGGVNALCSDEQGCGTIFELAPTTSRQSSGWRETQLATFSDATGSYPNGTFAAYGGLLYGTAKGEGAYGYGSVFSFRPPSTRLPW